MGPKAPIFAYVVPGITFLKTRSPTSKSLLLILELNIALFDVNTLLLLTGLSFDIPQSSLTLGA